jgi:hypothetical protein
MDIKHWLKKYFIPHEKNDHRPHFLRTESTIFVLVFVILIEAFFIAQPVFFQKTNLFASILQNVLVSETNSSRQSENISALKESPLLDAAAQMKAEDMAAKGYFAHVSPQGLAPWYWMKQVGYNYTYAGENLAINFSDSEDVIKAWLNSPAHRENLLSQHFTEIGIATARGTYEGRDTIFIVQMFGAPAELSVAVLPQPKTAVLPAETIPLPAATSNRTVASVKGAETSAVLEENSAASVFTWKIFTSPKEISYYIYALLSILVSIALLLNVAIKPKIQHPKLILNGVLLLFIINTIIILNNYLSFLNAKIF